MSGATRAKRRTLCGLQTWQDSGEYALLVGHDDVPIENQVVVIDAILDVEDPDIDYTDLIGAADDPLVKVAMGSAPLPSRG